jgi:hypothetical protein
VALDARQVRIGRQRAEDPERQARVEVDGVRVEEADELAGRRRESAPERVGLAAGGVALAIASRAAGRGLDPAADRPRPAGDRVELAAQRRLGVRVGGGDQPVGGKQLRGEVHRLAARVADAGLDRLDDPQRHVAGARVGAAVGTRRTA